MAISACPLVFSHIFALLLAVTTLLPAAIASPTASIPVSTSFAKANHHHRQYVDRDALGGTSHANGGGQPSNDNDVLWKRDPTPTETDDEGGQGAASTPVATSPLPSPFDGSMTPTFTGNNGNGECPRFINSFLTSPTFKACYPFSILLQGSQGFFEAQKSAVTMTQVLQATCEADVGVCAPYLSGLAEELLLEENCREDYDLRNSIVRQAYNGMVAYRELYTASCLQDPDQGAYCYTSAVTNYTDTSNAYLYYLPLNQTLPEQSKPSCNWCVQTTMNVYRSAAANRTLPIAKTYENAARLVNAACGPEFVNQSLPQATEQNSAGKALLDMTLVATGVILAVFFQMDVL